MKRLRPECGSAFRAALEAAGRRSEDPLLTHRLHAVLLVSLGHSCYEVASRIGQDPRTVERWVRTYETLGCEGLREHHGGGRPARLTATQRADLDRILAQDPAAQGLAQPRWSGKLLVLQLERRFGVRLSLRQCQRLLGTARRGADRPLPRR